VNTKNKSAPAGGGDGAQGETVGFQRAIDVLYDLYRHRDLGSLPARILLVAVRLVACDSAVHARIDPETRSFSLVSSPEDAFADLDHKVAADLHMRDHPLVAHFSTRRDARAWMLHDLVSRDAFQRTALYRSLYRRLGIEFQLVLLLPYPDGAPRALVLNRRDKAFSEDDRRRLEYLWPHFTQAVRNARALSRKRGVPELDDLPPGLGVLVLDRSAKVQLCTEQARIWLTQYCQKGFTQREIRSLPEPVAGWVGRALGDRTLRLRGIANPVEPLVMQRADQFLAMRFIADHGRGQHLILMDESVMNAPPDLLLGLGLTQREAEVLAWVAQGKTNRETGAILEMSPRTVQKHLERIFSKLGVESRTGAILKAWQVGRFEGLVPGQKLGATDGSGTTRPSNPRSGAER
jgi:DNA-binding CsgD family transcriptional regulator